MKTQIVSLFAVLGTLASVSLPAASHHESPLGFVVTGIFPSDGDQIEVGASLMKFRRLMGPAQRELTPNVWAYYGYRAPRETPGAENCDTLLVTFVDGKVADLKVVNEAAVRVIAAGLKLSPGPARLARN